MDIHNYQSQTEGDVSRYLVDSPLEIERILRGMMEQKILVSGSGNKSKNAFITTVLGVDGQSRQFFLESPLDGHMDDDLLVKDGAAFSARYENVQIQFIAGLGKRLEHEGRAAYRLPFPTRFLRFQRREYYRVEVPRANPSKCRFTLANQKQVVEGVVADISIGGIGLTYKPGEADVALGQVIHGCRLFIPEVGEFVVSLKVRNQIDLTLRNGEHAWRIGCEFIDLPSIVERELQRYIFKIERDRHAQAK
ncbi:c-di-GMP-binding flagellar brake protein YcgR [Sulfuritortus calidifontis]|uniref:Flagellar brake protein YcgR n=1 Tax=Sulfuritortus calidifontis TaxID=1914471 RepID=A0A4R3JWY4_9PROT|nr:flagellar brake protein [Sulfuritortus calidifontis]TCS71018.1 c-di-GMP-binding flagellar brake protein YcgR [Sulfuritortus calidifontis]